MAEHITPLQAWILAARPKTLPAAIAPVLVGAALAFAVGSFALLPALAAMIGAVLIQIGVNFANDYFDFVSGVDTPDRVGPVRVAASGLISPQALRLGMVVVFGLAVMIGVYLVIIGGLPIVAIGIASILAALAYSGGPFPIASNGLGDLFVFIFFGLVAVGGTYYVQTRDLTTPTLIAGAGVGFLNTAILVVNNYRDIDTDRRTGKRTLAVILGRKASQVEYIALIAGAYMLLPLLWVVGSYSPFVLLAFLSLPLAFPLIRDIRTLEGPPLNKTLAGTARLALVYCMLLSLGLAVGHLVG
jgi:1,4-dihydroxy-2-naphthoate octaprenyltransferase